MFRPFPTTHNSQAQADNDLSLRNLVAKRKLGKPISISVGVHVSTNNTTASLFLNYEVLIQMMRPADECTKGNQAKVHARIRRWFTLQEASHPNYVTPTQSVQYNSTQWLPSHHAQPFTVEASILPPNHTA